MLHDGICMYLASIASRGKNDAFLTSLVVCVRNCVFLKQQLNRRRASRGPSATAELPTSHSRRCSTCHLSVASTDYFCISWTLNRNADFFIGARGRRVVGPRARSEKAPLWIVLCFMLFHRRTRASYVYNVCLAWYNIQFTDWITVTYILPRQIFLVVGKVNHTTVVKSYISSPRI